MEDKDTKKLSITEAVALMNCTATTIYNRQKKYNWKHETDEEGRAYMHVPVKYLQQFENYINKAQENNKQDLKTKEADNPLATEYLDKVVKILETAMTERLADKTELLATKEALIKSQEAQISALNNQLQAAQSQIIHLRNGSKNQDAKPWWRFWENGK